MRSRAARSFDRKIRVHAQRVGGAGGFVEQIPDDLAVHRRAFGDGGGDALVGDKVVFRRGRRRGDEFAVFAFNQIGQPEFRRAAHGGIHFAQIIFVLREGVMLP